MIIISSRSNSSRSSSSLYAPFGSPCRGQKPQGRRGNRSSCRSEPLRFKVGGSSEVSPEELCGMEPHDNRLIPLSNSVLLYHFSDIRDFIEYGITNLIIWKFTTFTQISYKISAYTTKIRQDDSIPRNCLSCASKNDSCLLTRISYSPCVISPKVRWLLKFL